MDYSLLNSASPGQLPKKVRASCTGLQYVFILTLTADFISTFAYLSELSFQHFIFVFSNITKEYNMAWNNVDVFFLSIVRVTLYLCYFTPYLFKSWYVYSSSSPSLETLKEHVILSNINDLKFLRRRVLYMIFFSILIFIYTMAKCISRLIISKPNSTKNTSSMFFFWFAVGSDAFFTSLEFYLCSKLIIQVLKATNNFMDNETDNYQEEDTIDDTKKNESIAFKKKYRNKICPLFNA
jgi:hypothetical protein